VVGVGGRGGWERAAAFSVDAECVAICREGGVDPREAGSVRQPALPPPGGHVAFAVGVALGNVY
ncbi:DNA utilization protein HofM, partial [Escherichia coli]